MESPFLHLDVSIPQGPELHLDVSSLQELLLHLNVSPKQGPELHLDVSGGQGPLLVWTCLHHRSLSCTSPGRVYTTENFAAPGHGYTTGT
jgi:hypothetical protein